MLVYLTGIKSVHTNCRLVAMTTKPTERLSDQDQLNSAELVRFLRVKPALFEERNLFVLNYILLVIN